MGEHDKEAVSMRDNSGLMPDYDTVVGEIWKHQAAGDKMAAQAVMDLTGINIEFEGDGR